MLHHAERDDLVHLLGEELGGVRPAVVGIGGIALRGHQRHLHVDVAVVPVHIKLQPIQHPLRGGDPPNTIGQPLVHAAAEEL